MSVMVFFLLVSTAVALAGLLIWIGRESIFAFTMLHGPVFVASRQADIQQMMQLAEQQADEVAVDLGAGDGAIVLAVAEQRRKILGVELNPLLVKRAQKKIVQKKLQLYAAVIEQNFWQTDLSKYDVIYLYGTTYIMEKLQQKLKDEMKPGSRLISNYFQLPDWKPVKQAGKLRVYMKPVA